MSSFGNDLPTRQRVVSDQWELTASVYRKHAATLTASRREVEEWSRSGHHAGIDGQLVLHVGDARRVTCRTFGVPELGVRAHLSAQDRHVPLDVDGDALGVELRATLQGLLDLLFDVGRRGPCADGDQIRHAFDTGERTDSPLCRPALAAMSDAMTTATGDFMTRLRWN